jgi:hypothetical protein
MKIVAGLISLLLLSGLRFADNSVPCVHLDKANGNYLILNDTNRLQFNFPVLSRYQITNTGGILIHEKNNIYKVITRQKKDVEITVMEKETMVILYAKKFNVVNSKSEIKADAVTNSITSCFSIVRLDENYVLPGIKNKFVYFSNENGVKIECENGSISNKSKKGFDVKPNDNAQKIKIKFIYRKAEIGSWEYLVRK